MAADQRDIVDRAERRFLLVCAVLAREPWLRRAALALPETGRRGLPSQLADQITRPVNRGREGRGIVATDADAEPASGREARRRQEA